MEKGCAYCDDFVARLADVSVGSVGSSNGYSAVILRSEVGKKLLNATDFIKEVIDKEEIVKLIKLKKENANKNFSFYLFTSLLSNK